jgi:hypothetical protein
MPIQVNIESRAKNLPEKPFDKAKRTLATLEWMLHGCCTKIAEMTTKRNALVTAEECCLMMTLMMTRK